MESAKVQQQYERLNYLAYELKFNKELSPTQTTRYQSELFSGVLRITSQIRRLRKSSVIIGIRSKFAKYDLIAQEDEEKSERLDLEPLSEKECIGFDVVVDSYMTAQNKFGTEEYKEKDGTIRPFCAVYLGVLKTNVQFNYSYERDEFFEKNLSYDEETHNYYSRDSERYTFWKKRVKEILTIVAQASGIANYTAPNNITNYEKIRDEVLKFGFDEIEATRKASKINEEANYLVSIHGGGSEESSSVETGNEFTDLAFDHAYFEKQITEETIKNNALQKIMSAYDLVMKDENITKTDKKYIRCYINMTILEADYTDNDFKNVVGFKKILMPKFMTFLKTYEAVPNAPYYMAIADFLGRKPETIRKKMVVITRILAEKSQECRW